MSQRLTTLPRARFEAARGVALIVRRKIIGTQWAFEKGQRLRGERDPDGTWKVWPPHDEGAYLVQVPRWYVRLDRRRAVGRKRVATGPRHSPNVRIQRAAGGDASQQD